ncbi:MAG: zinc ribbon domain-containing protein [Pseudomonadota bacterium]
MLNCRNCGAELSHSDRYCPNCGQGVAEGQERCLIPLLKSALIEVTSVDSRLWRSLGALVLKPGLLAREYRAGRRRRYLSPIGLFLLGNLLYFLAPPLSDLQLSLTEQYELQPYRHLITPWVDSYIAVSGSSFDEVARRYELRIAELAKIMVILFVPLVALVTMVLFADRRLYFADHLVLALHYMAFLLLYFISTGALAAFAYLLIPERLPSSAVTIMLLAHFVYLPPMFKRAFDVSWWRALVTAPIFVFGFFLAHITYRYVQFNIAFLLTTLA